MKLELIWIGKASSDILDNAINQYIKRISFYIPFAVTAIPYLKNTATLSADEQKKKEGELILHKIESSDIVVLLDEHGKEMSSVAFSQFIRQQNNRGIKKLVFVIGGAYGFSDTVYHRADFMLSLSRFTFPHILTRLIFVEQLYRAFTILKNEPYHHE